MLRGCLNNMASPLRSSILTCARHHGLPVLPAKPNKASSAGGSATPYCLKLDVTTWGLGRRSPPLGPRLYRGSDCHAAPARSSGFTRPLPSLTAFVFFGGSCLRHTFRCGRLRAGFLQGCFHHLPNRWHEVIARLSIAASKCDQPCELKAETPSHARAPHPSDF